MQRLTRAVSDVERRSNLTHIYIKSHSIVLKAAIGARLFYPGNQLWWLKAGVIVKRRRDIYETSKTSTG